MGNEQRLKDRERRRRRDFSWQRLLIASSPMLRIPDQNNHRNTPHDEI